MRTQRVRVSKFPICVQKACYKHALFLILMIILYNHEGVPKKMVCRDCNMRTQRVRVSKFPICVSDSSLDDSGLCDSCQSDENWLIGMGETTELVDGNLQLLPIVCRDCPYQELHDHVSKSMKYPALCSLAAWHAASRGLDTDSWEYNWKVDALLGISSMPIPREQIELDNIKDNFISVLSTELSKSNIKIERMVI